MTAVVEVSDLRALLALLGAIVIIIGGMWAIVRNSREAFVKGVSSVSAPALEKLDQKVDRIGAQVTHNDGSSLKDVVLRTEEKVTAIAELLKEKGS